MEPIVGSIVKKCSPPKNGKKRSVFKRVPDQDTTVAGFAVAGATVAGFAVAGFAVAGFAVAGATVAGATVAGFARIQ